MANDPEVNVVVDFVLIDLTGHLTQAWTECERVATPFALTLNVTLPTVDLRNGFFAISANDLFGVYHLATATFVPDTSALMRSGACGLSGGVILIAAASCMRFQHGIGISWLVIQNEFIVGQGIENFDAEGNVDAQIHFSIYSVGQAVSASAETAAQHITNTLTGNGVIYSKGVANWNGHDVFTVAYPSQSAQSHEIRIGFVVHEGQLYMARFEFWGETDPAAIDKFWGDLATNIDFY